MIISAAQYYQVVIARLSFRGPAITPWAEFITDRKYTVAAPYMSEFTYRLSIVC